MTPRVVRKMIISDAATWSVTYDYHLDASRDVIYDHNVFIIQAVLQLATLKLALVFNSRSGCVRAMNLLCVRTKLPNLS
jgi:hypothetical protein